MGFPSLAFSWVSKLIIGMFLGVVGVQNWLRAEVQSNGEVECDGRIFRLIIGDGRWLGLGRVVVSDME